MIKVLSVDDDPLRHEGIAALVNAESDMKLIAEWIRLQDGAKSPATGDRIGRFETTCFYSETA